jgi:hypothetical protein
MAEMSDSSITYVGICFEHLPNSNTLASVRENYVCFTDNFYEACDKVYSYIINDSLDARQHKTYHIEKYDICIEELQSRGILPYPINFYTFNEHFDCICNKTNVIVWQP